MSDRHFKMFLLLFLFHLLLSIPKPSTAFPEASRELNETTTTNSSHDEDLSETTGFWIKEIPVSPDGDQTSSSLHSGDFNAEKYSLSDLFLRKRRRRKRRRRDLLF
eukprot:TRINITY_DN3858_c0_g1_i1.p1 TRINITY_DN3858_c0_g1~~TRINITY_DN3858_c0_g1_i1.p1  ORF type:complete len:106 (+),score=9.66 TRINITY_DN3858_c0_g1_i1:120-437(+)